MKTKEFNYSKCLTDLRRENEEIQLFEMFDGKWLALTATQRDWIRQGKTVTEQFNRRTKLLGPYRAGFDTKFLAIAHAKLKEENPP